MNINMNRRRYITFIISSIKWIVTNITSIIKYSIITWISVLILTKGADIAALLPKTVYNFGQAIYCWIDNNIWLNGVTFIILILFFIWIETNRHIIKNNITNCILLLFGILLLNTLPVWYPLDSIIGIPYNILVTAYALFFAVKQIYYRFQKDNRKKDIKPEASRSVFRLTTEERDLTDTGWQSYANSLVKMFPTNGINKESMAVGIYGEWGTGKTTFLNHIRKELKHKYIIIDFNPWRCLSAEAIVTDFFKTLKRHLYQNNELVNAIEDYMEILKPISMPDWITWLTCKLTDKNDETISSMKSKIENLLKDNGKQVAVLIDDIDRLEGDEVFEVMRLIRITANFHNIVFIAAYDKKHVCEMLRCKGIESSEQYIEKIFNVELSLPRLEDRTIPYVIQKELYGMTELDDIHKREIEKALWKYKTNKDNKNKELLISSYIHNFREAKRFAAILALSLNHLKKTGLDEFYLYDLFWIEILHFCQYNDYETLSNNPFSILEISTNFISKESRGAGHFTLKTPGNNDDPILYLLFSQHSGATANHRRACFVNSYTKYFCYRMPSTIIPLTDFQILMHNSDADAIKNKIRQWGSNTVLNNSLVEHLAQFNIYYTEKDHVVKNYITALVAANPYIDKNKELNIYHNKFLSSCCRSDIKDFFKDALGKAIAEKPSAVWNDVLSAMVSSHCYDDMDDLNYEEYILDYEDIKELMEQNMEGYLKKHGKPHIADISDKTSNFNKFIIAGSYISMYYTHHENNGYEKTEDYANPLCERLMQLYRGDKATDFDEFIKPFTVTDYDDELYEEKSIAELTEQIFCSKDNFMQFIKDSFEQTDEVRGFITKYK